MRLKRMTDYFAPHLAFMFLIGCLAIGASVATTLARADDSSAGSFQTVMLVAQNTTAAAPTVATVAAPGAISSFISSQGGFLLAVGSIVFCLNLFFSSIASICNKLKISENTTLVKIGNVVGSANSWMSANTNPPAPAPATVPASQPPSSSS